MLGAAGSGSAARVPRTTGGRTGGVGMVFGRETCEEDGGFLGEEPRASRSQRIPLGLEESEEQIKQNWISPKWIFPSEADVL